jgi:uncharacterized membrane protein
VSDTAVTDQRRRRGGPRHALLSYLFRRAVVLAITVNCVAALLGS